MVTSISGKKILLLLVLVLLTALLFGKPSSGTIAYIEGYVDLYRDGELLDWEMVDIGFEVREFDLIETGNDGLVEIELNLPSGTSTSITVSQDTAFYFEMKEQGGKNQTAFQMMSGSISFKVQKLTGRDGLNVQTESAAMGVRGTEFEVVYSPEGGVLVLCNEGAVSVKDNQGREKYSRPGSVIAKVPDSGLSAFSVDVDDLGLYRNYWVSSREEIFKSGADVFIKGYAKQFLLFGPKFQSAFRALMEEKSTLERYGKESPDGSMGTLFKAKSEVSSSVIKMRSILPIFEMTFYRLKVLEKYYNEGLGHGVIGNGLTTEKFFNDFSAQRDNISRQLAEVRYLFKLYNNLHNATGGGPSILETPFGGSGVPSGNPPTGNPFGN